MGLHGWLLLDSAMGQHLLSEQYTPAFGLPFPGGDPTALGMSLAALVFALKQNADCVFPRPEPGAGDRGAEWRQHARDPQWVDASPNASSVLSHMVGDTRLVFFQHQCFDLMCVVASSLLVPGEGCAFVAEALCKRFLRFTGGEIPNTPAHRAFRPMAHAVLRSLARRFCCARIASTLWSICRSPWVLLTYSPPLTAAIHAPDVPVLKPVPRSTALAFAAWRRQQSPPESVTPPDTELEQLLERCRGLRGASLLYLNVEEDLDVGLPRTSPPGTTGDLLSPNSGVKQTVTTNATTLAMDEEQPSTDDDASAERTIMRSMADLVDHLDGPVLALRIAESLRRVGPPVPHLLAVLHQFEWDGADASFRVPPDGPRRSQLAHQLRDSAARASRAYQVGSGSSFVGRSEASLLTTASLKQQRLRGALQRHFLQTDEAIIVATLLDLTVTTAKLRRLCLSPATALADDTDDLDIECHLGSGRASAQVKVVKQGDMYLAFPIASSSATISSALLK
eukprot:EG_transcript_9128